MRGWGGTGFSLFGKGQVWFFFCQIYCIWEVRVWGKGDVMGWDDGLMGLGWVGLGYVSRKSQDPN